MANYQFHPTLVLRLPVYSYQAYGDTDLQKVLQTDYFKKAIYFSSEVFYKELQKKDFDLEKLDKKAIETLRKYFNRMCFRPTPFALYSGIGTVMWGEGETDIHFGDKNIEPDIRFSHAKNQEYAQQLLLDNSDQFIYKPNTTFYKTGNEFRFIKQSNQGVQVDFIIDSLKSDRFFEQLINYLNPGRKLAEITVYIVNKAACSTYEANTYIQWLIDNQVINNQFEANITGEDYLNRLIDSDLRDDSGIGTAFSKLKSINNIELLTDIPSSINNEIGEIKSADFYVNLKINFPECKLSTTYQQSILDGLHCLDKLSPSNALPAALADFIKNFNKKFDGQTVPLLLALDPEVGVGYNDLATAGDDANIAKNIIGGGDKSGKTTVNWSDAHTMLFKKWQSKPTGQSAIVITDDDLALIKQTESNPASTISVMFRVVDDKVLIESAGGNTATALIGRFTPLSADIRQLAIDMANKEVEHNPHIIFAEIAHICHSHTANIDRRLNIYPYEIPVLVQSTLPVKNQLPLTDLLVSVVNGNVILQSKTHGKRVIPRLSSAFNYTRNDLAVFRFLCDLQSAEIKTRFSFNLSQFFPGLDFYPRVEYKNTILQLAYWNLERSVFDSVFKASKEQLQTAFNNIRQQLNLPKHIALTQSDNQLVFDLDKAKDVAFFLDNVKTLSQIKVAEFLFPDADHQIVLNDYQMPHINQFVASLFHDEQIYKPCNIQLAANASKVQRKYLPGSEWLYFKIYCHPVRSNELLSGLVFKTVNKLMSNEKISEWFFIRYLDPDYHIRLRLKVSSQHHQQVLHAMQKTLYEYTAQGIISNIVVDSYDRELERYSPELMEDSEKVFHASSNFVASFLNKKQTPETTDVLEFAIVSVNDILACSGLDGTHLISFLDRVFNSFSNEFKTIDNLKYQLDTEYRQQRQIIEQVGKQSPEYYHALKLSKARKLFVASISNTIQKIDASKSGRKERWLSDIIHMHLNRLFMNDPRKQEMTIYYFLLKYQTSLQARKTKT